MNKETKEKLTKPSPTITPLECKITMSTPEVEISNNAKICYGNEKNDKDITTQLVHGHGHLAALRFAYCTVEVQGISVACQNQIVRSKHLDFMVQSKRYVSSKKGNFNFVYPRDLSLGVQELMQDHWNNSIELYHNLLELGTKKEDARTILPAGTSTKMNITGNLQAWYDFFVLRMNSHAQKEVQEVAETIFDLFSELYPKVFTKEMKERLQ